jgi:GntR family transcriptional regulator/GntR family frlABCD operon transcriptional regulator
LKSYHYQIIYNDLKNDILKGVYEEGDLLPSENVLSAKYGITRTTVRQALLQLVVDGFISKRHGKGSIVTKRSKKSLGVLSVRGFSDIVNQKNRRVNTIMLIKPEKRDWPEDFFHRLSEKESKQKSIFVKRLRMVDDNPVMLESTYLADYELQGFCDNEFVNGSLFDTLSVRYGIEIVGVEQDLRAIEADQEMSDLLKIRNKKPVLHVILRFITRNPDFSIYSSLICNTDNYSISNVLN